MKKLKQALITALINRNGFDKDTAEIEAETILDNLDDLEIDPKTATAAEIADWADDTLDLIELGDYGTDHFN